MTDGGVSATGASSRTALSVARHRATHQVLEEGKIFADPLAIRLLGESESHLEQEARAHPHRRRMRVFVCVRQRFAEESLAEAVAERGVTQYVVLGAGLDSFAYRSAFGEQLRVFEVDHPASQRAKRDRLAAAGIEVPAWLTFAPCDFERESIGDALRAARFDAEQATVFAWLGVVPYLTQEAVWTTLRYVASVASASVVFDYANPKSALADEQRRAAFEAASARVAELGEPWVTFFDTDELVRRVRESGFDTVDDLGPVEIAKRYFPHRIDEIRDNVGGHILRASKSATVTLLKD